MPIAYSYLRFSSEEQRKGTTLERQSLAAERFIAENPQFGLVMDKTLSMVDDGVSAYRGKNLKNGALGVFVDAVRDGHIPEGSWLLLESLDRFTRQQVNIAASDLLNLINRGIVVVTLNNGNIYKEDDFVDGNGLVNLLGALIAMQGHHAEQVTKGKRVSSAWAIKRGRIAEGHVITSNVPFWLEKRNDLIVVKEDRAAIVREVFSRKANGEGKTAIANDLTSRRVPTPKGFSETWHASAVMKLLDSDAVVGRLKTVDGGVFEDYFPRVVDEEVFQAVRALRQQVGSVGAGVTAHPLSGLIKHSCGTTMRRRNKGDGYEKLVCPKCKVTMPFNKALEAASGALFQLQYSSAPIDEGADIHGAQNHLSELLEEQTDAFERFKKSRAFETRKLYERLTTEVEAVKAELLEMNSRNTTVILRIEDAALRRQAGLKALKSVLVSAVFDDELTKLTIKSISGKEAVYEFSDHLQAL